MIIRCEKCSTVYELDDHLVPAGGAPVQCSRCQFVFTAMPAGPRPPLAASTARPGAEGSPGASAPPAAISATPQQQEASPAASRPVRRVDMASVEREDAQRMAQAAARPEISGPPAAFRAPKVESGKRWLWPALVAALLAAGIALYAWRASSGSAPAAKPAAGAPR